MYAQLIEGLALAGSRKADGTPNASGRAWFYVPGSLLAATVYSNATATAALTQPVSLDAAGKAVVFTTQPVRVIVEYLVSGTSYLTLSDSTALMDAAGAVGVRNPGWTGALPDGSQGAGGDGTLDAVLTAIKASTNGVDGKFLESSGATARPIRDKFVEISISVKDFNAKGDGLTTDTIGLQAAINRVGALGGGVVLIPPGTYLFDAALSTNLPNVTIRGAGRSVTTLKQINNAGGGLSFGASATGAAVEGLTLQASDAANNAGAGLTLTDASGAVVKHVLVTGFKNPMSVLGGTDLTMIGNALVAGSAAAGVGKPLAIADANRVTILGGYIAHGGNAAGIYCSGTTSRLSVFGVYITATTSIDVSTCTGTKFKVIGCHLESTTQFAFGAAEPADFYQYGNQVDGYTVNTATTAAVTPDRSKGSEIRINANSGGAGVVTVNAPTPTPARRGTRLTLKLVNAAGGAVTWTMNAVFVQVGGTAPVGTDGTTSIMEYLWDSDASKYREVSRANSTT